MYSHNSHPSSTRGSGKGTSGSRTFSRPSFNSRGPRPAYQSRGVRPARSAHSYSSRGSAPRTARGNKGAGKGQYINPALFVQKAVITETVNVFVPEHKFSDFAVDERLKKNIIDKGYVTPTPIQDKAIPHVLRGSDVVGIANTGTGKTAAFLIPLIHKVLSKPKENVLIVVPTRELAQQIQEELDEFTPGLRMHSTCVVGGAPIGKQIASLRYRNEFVIGTPGRIKDLIERKALNLSYFNTVVLDEADRMLDMGFIHDMRTLMAAMPKPRHTLFFSATMSPEIKNLISEFLNEPVSISVKTADTAKNVDQDIVRVERGANKIDILHDLLNTKGFEKVVIFGRTKHGVEKLSKVLTDRGFKSESIHGNKTQSARQRALSKFKENHSKILVATDVAARGLDINDVTHVINFDLPATYEDYVHRVGRTGRAGKTGKALTFVE